MQALLRHRCATLVLALAAVGCKTGSGSSLKDDDGPAASAAGRDAQMNDLSVLYPMAKTQAEVDSAYLTPASAGVGGALLDQSTYAAATDGLVPPPSSLIHSQLPDLASLRLMAFRLDPCFANIGPITAGATCDYQLRVIFQPLIVTASGVGGGSGTPTFTNQAVSAQDMAVHVFYGLTRDQFFAAVDAIIALRKANSSGDLGPLAVHPVMASQGLAGAMATGLNAILLKYVGVSNLKRVAAFQRVGFGQFSSNWTMQAVDVAGGQATLSPIPTLPDDSTAVTVSQPLHNADAGSLHMKQLGVDQSTTAADDVSLLLGTDSATATAAARQKAYDAAIHIENPNVHSPNTIDCASCHLAAIARRFGQDGFQLTPSAAAPLFAPPAGVAADAMQASTQATPLLNADGQSPTNIHQFSYNEDGPMIMQRVINETAANVAYVNSVPPSHP